MNPHIYFLCGAKDFHAMDKFRLTAATVGLENITLITDTFEGEGQHSLVQPDYQVRSLAVIDRFTLAKPSGFADRWRNLVKLAALPVQILRLRKLRRELERSIVHAAPIYYMLLCWLSRITYIGTPQGSEVLVRPNRSRVYRYFARHALRGAKVVIVDSLAMRDAVRTLAGRDTFLVKNGFDTARALAMQSREALNKSLFSASVIGEGGGIPELKRIPRQGVRRERVLSIRGCQPLYRIDALVAARNAATARPLIDFVYPAADPYYIARVRQNAVSGDTFRGMVTRDILYERLAETLLAISIPQSDSSPRSVFEAIFCGAIVAVTRAGYYDELPACMRARLFLVDLDDPQWFDQAIAFARERVATPYVPSPAALALCDQFEAIGRIVTEVYRIAPTQTKEQHIEQQG